MNFKEVGKFQFWTGCILLLITIIVSIFAIKFIYLGSMIPFAEGVTETWGDTCQEINCSSIGGASHVVSYMLMGGTIVKTIGGVFITCILILIALSVMLITQGLTNQNRK